MTVYPIPFQQSRFRQMALASLRLAKTFTDLKNTPKARRQQSFHTQFGRGLQKPVTGRDGIDMGLGCRRRNADRSFDFQIIIAGKELPGGLKNAGPKSKVLMQRNLMIIFH
jgi:hypothetical protein